MPRIIVCERCGGANLQVMDWVDANLDIVIGGNDTPHISNVWCEDCDGNVELKSVSASREKWLELRAKRGSKLSR